MARAYGSHTRALLAMTYPDYTSTDLASAAHLAAEDAPEPIGGQYDPADDDGAIHAGSPDVPVSLDDFTPSSLLEDCAHGVIRCTCTVCNANVF